MSGMQLQTGSFLPTIASTYRAVEAYLEFLEASSGGVPASPPVPLLPIDALLISLVATYQHGRPSVLDLASAATWGASTVLCRTITAVRSVAVPRGSAESWHFPMSRFLHDLDQPLAEAIDVKDDQEALRILAHAPVPHLVLTTVGARDLAASVERWLACSPQVLVLVLGIGETGTCPDLAALTAWCGGSAYRLALLRERAPALAGSALAVVGHRANQSLYESLLRIGGLFNDHFRYLDLVKQACFAALDQVQEDEALFAMRIGEVGQHTEHTEPDSIRVLRRALDERNRELMDLRNSLTVRLVTRLRRLMRSLAPPASPQRWVALKVRAGVRRLRRGRAAGARPGP